ncbi:hypothetical protein ACJVDH_00400 [Pedobacter sp. AW1-32]|uniref:hypothetical protein n=1 Tax=Pedobacter sp. AW1-32 TaxID=3383026 RepID=UPI003FF01847
MRWVKFNRALFVEATGVEHKAGDVAEVSDEFAKRHGDDGTGIVQQTDEPVPEVKSLKKTKVKKEEAALSEE